MATLIRFGCPKCQTTLQLSGAAAGKKVKCPRCGAAVLVPADRPLINGAAHDDEDSTSPLKTRKKKLKKKHEETGNKALFWGVAIGLIVLVAGGAIVTTVLLMKGDGNKGQPLAANNNPAPAPAPAAAAQPNPDPAPAAQPDPPEADAAQPPAAAAPGPQGGPGGGMEEMMRRMGGGQKPPGGQQGPGGAGMEEMMRRMGGGQQGQKPPAGQQGPGGMGDMMRRMMGGKPQGPGVAQGGQKPPPADGGDGQAGADAPKPSAAVKKIFDANCARCHTMDGSQQPIGGFAGIAGRGAVRGPDLSKVGADPSHTTEWIVEQVKNPRRHNPQSRMPAFAGKIRDKELRELAEFLAGLK